MPAHLKDPPTTCPIQPEKMLAAAVSRRVGQARFGLWFQGHARFRSLGRAVHVVVRNQQTRDWLEQTFGKDVREAVAEICGAGTGLAWQVDADLFESAPAIETPVAPSANRGSSKPAPEKAIPQELFGEREPPPKTRPKPPVEVERVEMRVGRRWRILTEFVVGRCNRVAHAAARNVVEEPGEVTPLILHGPVGTGKTHLLEGIFAGLKRAGAEERPCYVTAEEFTSKFVAASQHGKMGAFRRQYRECSALLVDDLNFLASKKATQAEFLHTFDSLIADGRQVVVATDCHPRLSDEFMPELVDRLLGGAIWGLLPPDPETRLEILRKKATGPGPAIPDDVLKALAARLRGNVRELEGAINGVRHFAKVTGRPVDLVLAREALGELLRHAVRTVTVANIDAAVCAALRLGAGTLQSKSRAWIVTHPRMIAIYLSRKHTAATYGEISKYYRAKTHSTAVAAEKKVRAWIETDASIAIGDREWRARELIDRVEHELQK